MTLDVPVALGLLVLFGRSIVDIVSGRGEGFLDSFAGLVFFLLHRPAVPAEGVRADRLRSHLPLVPAALGAGRARRDDLAPVPLEHVRAWRLHQRAPRRDRARRCAAPRRSAAPSTTRSSPANSGRCSSAPATRCAPAAGPLGGAAAARAAATSRTASWRGCGTTRSSAGRSSGGSTDVGAPFGAWFTVGGDRACGRRRSRLVARRRAPARASRPRC